MLYSRKGPLLGLGPVAIALSAWLSACSGTPRAALVWVEIPADAPVTAIAESLAAHGIVPETGDFERAAMRNRRYREIRPGIYALRPGTPAREVLSVLMRGHPPVAKVILRERMTLAEVAAEMERALGIPADSTLAAARDAELRGRLGARAATVEGYLYPTMYYLALEARPITLLRQIADTFEARWNPAWNSRLDSLGISRDEAVTLASIVAGEMPTPEDVTQVASVYHNRLARGMRLQADPTVVYALGERRRLYFNDYRVASDYNTYTISGLPPGPINQPSTGTIEAALYPDDTEYLYFVGRWDGTHQFSKTYREHLRAIAQVRGKRTAVSRTPPRTRPAVASRRDTG